MLNTFRSHLRLWGGATLWVLLALGLAQAGAAAAAGDASAGLAALADRYYEQRLKLDPIEATALGDDRYNGELVVTIAPREQKARVAFYEGVARELARIARKDLGPADRLNRDLLAHELAGRLAFERLPFALMPIDHMESLPVLLANWASGQGSQALRTPADYERFLARLAKLPEWTDQAIANMKTGMARGIVQPRVLIARVLPQIQSLAALPAEHSPYYRPAANFPAGFSAADRERLQAAYRELVERRIAPAMARLASFLGGDYLAAGRASAGLGGIKGGAAWYATLVRESTTTRLTPEAIHRLGLSEVSRIRAEIAALAGPLQYAGDPGRLLAWAASDARFRPYRSVAEILEAYRRLDARIVPRLAELFGRRPAEPLEIRAEPELTRSTASDHYTLPAQDGSRPGIFWAVINDPADYTQPRMAALYLHEGQPGHHFHLALQQKLELPRFRRHSWIGAYGEGWALYAEGLGRELGLYDDPVFHLGRLQMELLRAVRLVVDTGIHRHGWSREKAMAYMQQVQGIGEDEARVAAERYMAWPGQALAYKVGELKLLELRRKAQTALGPRFRLADFHDLVLAEGAMPLDLLEARVNNWIAAPR